MNKIYTIIAALIVSTTVFSQTTTIPDGDFEQPGTSFFGLFFCGNWIGYNAEINDTDPGEGLQSVKVSSILENDTVRTGFLFQSYSEGPSDLESVRIDFLHTYTSGAGTDHGGLVIEVSDTLGAGADDDVLLYQGVAEIETSVATWTTKSFFLTPTGATGTPNSTTVFIAASIGAIMPTSTVEPQDGSIIQVDKIQYVVSSESLKEANALNHMVYPNPASKSLQLSCSEPVEKFSVLALNGQLLKETTTNSIDVATLSAGVYLYKVVTKNGNVITEKFVKD